MIWHVNIKRDYGMRNTVETDYRLSHDAYVSLQRAIARCCEDAGDYVRMSVTAKNNEGMTLISEGMGWTKDGMRDFEDVCYQAAEHSAREGVF